MTDNNIILIPLFFSTSFILSVLEHFIQIDFQQFKREENIDITHDILRIFTCKMIIFTIETDLLDDVEV